MKKFLTVLLVIAVMFTFSFSSAFAVSHDISADAEAQRAYAAAVDYALTVASENFDKAVAGGVKVIDDGAKDTDVAVANGADDYLISAEAWAEVKTDVLLDLEKDIELPVSGSYSASFGDVTDWTQSTETIATLLFGSQKWWTKANMPTYLVEEAKVGTHAFVFDAAKEQFNVAYDKAEDILLNKIDYTAYTTAKAKTVKTNVSGILTDIEAFKAVVSVGYELTTAEPGDWSGHETNYFKKNSNGEFESVTGTPAWVADTYYEAVATTIAQLKTCVGEIAVKDISTDTGYLANIKAEVWNETANGYVAGDITDLSFTGKYLDKSVDTIGKTALEAPANTATKEGLKAEVSKAAADFLGDVVADSQIGEGKAFKTLAKAQEYAGSYQTVMNHLIDEELVDAVEAYVPDSHKLYSTGTSEPAAVAGTPGWVVATNQVTELGDYAKLYKAEKDATGALVRDAAAIDEIVEYATTDIYATKFGVAPYTPADSTMNNPYDLEGAKKAIKACTVEADNSKLAFDKEAAISDLEDIVDGYVVNETYYELELGKVKEALENAKVAINAASSNSAIDAAKDAFYRAVRAIKDATDVEALYTTASIDKELTTQAAAVMSYVNYKNASLKAYDEAKIVANTNAVKEALTDYYIEKGARTATEIKGMALDVTAVVDMLPTLGAQAAAKKAAEDAIKALPATSKIASADKAAIEKAKNLVKAATDISVDVDDNLEALLADDIRALERALKADLTTAYVAVDKTSKTALRDLQDKIDEFNKLYDKNNVLESLHSADFSIAGIATNLKKIQEAEAKAIRDAISALPINITEADKAQVEAARKLYDEYVADWTDVTDANNGYVAGDITNFRELALAEATLGLNAPEADPEEVAKAFVQDLGIKARSAKTSKGVKVTIKADVQELLDAGFTVEYKFYRSTKSNKGFKAMITKTTGTYTNTKGVKGTKYYYKAKLVVKNAEGEVVATTPLTQCLYATRTF